MKKPQITIIGAGFSGLTLAYFLVKKGFPVHVVHQGPIGGMIQTEIKREMQIEFAANSLLMSDSLNTLAKDVNCPLLFPQKTASAKFIFRNGLKRWPISLLSTIKLVFYYIPRFIFNSDKMKPYTSETVENWALRAFNIEILNYLISPFLQGIYAGDVKTLSASLVFPKKTSNPENSKRQIVAPPNGLHQLMSALHTYLSCSSVEFTQKKIDSINDYPSPRVLAVSFRDLVKLDPTLKVDKIKQLEIVRVTIGFKNAKHKISGFGVLFPSTENRNSLGVMANSQIFSNRGELYNESWILGGALNPSINECSDSEILEKIKQDRFQMFGIEEEWDHSSVIRWPQAYVHYDLELEKWLKSEPFKDKEYFVTGNYLGGLGLSKILELNKNLANQLAEKYG